MSSITTQGTGVQAQSSDLTPQARRAIWGAFIGFFVDNYDIFLPVIALAPAIAYFIPKTISPTTASIASAMIFATTLIGRPLGAFIFGHFADTVGRKRVAVISVFGFGVVTLLIAMLPGYSYWGDTVIYVFIALRLVDGIFLGGEYTSANTLAMEYCPKEKRGFYGAINVRPIARGNGSDDFAGAGVARLERRAVGRLHPSAANVHFERLV